MGVFRTVHGVLHQTSHVSPRSSYFALTSANFDVVNVIISLFFVKKTIGKTFEGNNSVPDQSS